MLILHLVILHLILYILHAQYISANISHTLPHARQGIDDQCRTSNSVTVYPGGLLRCDPPSPASVQPVLPVEDKRGRSNHPHRAPPTSSQPFCPYPIAITPQQYEVYTLQMAKRVTMRVHSPRFPKFGSWETPRPELANST